MKITTLQEFAEALTKLLADKPEGTKGKIVTGELVYMPDHYQDSPAVVDEAGFELIHVYPSAFNVGDDRQADMPLEIRQAMARRAVACWNACDGISTDNLEQNLPVSELAKRYNEALKKRDELQAALDRALELSNCAGSSLFCLLEGDTSNAVRDAKDAMVHLRELNKTALAAVKGGEA